MSKTTVFVLPQVLFLLHDFTVWIPNNLLGSKVNFFYFKYLNTVILFTNCLYMKIDGLFNWVWRYSITLSATFDDCFLKQ